MDWRDEWKVITLTWHFSTISILAHVRGNHPTLKHLLCARILKHRQTYDGLDKASCSHCVVLTNDIKHLFLTMFYLSSPTLHRLQCFPCQTTRGQGGWGNNGHWPAAIIPALRRLKFTPERLFLYMLLLLSLGFYKLELEKLLVWKQGIKTVGCVSSPLLAVSLLMVIDRASYSWLSGCDLYTKASALEQIVPCGREYRIFSVILAP